MLQGKKGVKYGLQLPARPPPKQVRKSQAPISAFQEGSDDEDTIGQQIARQQAKISTDVKVCFCLLRNVLRPLHLCLSERPSKSKFRVCKYKEVSAFCLQVANLHAKALEEDATIFDYDSHFDSMQEQKVRPAMQEKIERKSRYIEALKDKAVQREREQNVVYERR